MPDDVRARIAAMRDVVPEEVALGMHAHSNLSLAVANSLAAVQEGATLVDATLARLGAGAGNCQTEAIVAALGRLGFETGVDLWALQDVADDYVRKVVMTRPQEVDRLTLSLGYAGVPSSYLLHAERGAGAVRRRCARDPRRARAPQGRDRPGGHDPPVRRRSRGPKRRGDLEQRTQKVPSAANRRRTLSVTRETPLS